MSFANSIYSDPVLTQQNLDPSEAVYTDIMGTSNDFAIVIQLNSEVNRSGYPLPDPEENPSQTFHLSLYPIGYTDVRDTNPIVERTIVASGEEIVKSVKFNVVGMYKCQLRITNANDYGVLAQAWITEAQLT
jgi:hypothetical protein